jgi:hypothetical protein
MYFYGCALAAVLTVQQSPGQQAPSGQHECFVVFTLAAAQQSPGQQSPSGQHDAFLLALTAQQQAPSGQQSPPGQHDSTLADLHAFAAAQHGPSGQQSPPGQQDLALTSMFVLATFGLNEPEKAHVMPAAVSTSAAAQATSNFVRIGKFLANESM